MLGAAELRALGELGGPARVPPFVLITAFGDKELDAKAKQLGAIALLDKPLDIDYLRELVNEFLPPRTGAQCSMSVDSYPRHELRLEN
jgi:FixJ family two-component response regulator